MTHYIVIGRIDGDDDDDFQMSTLGNQDEALDAFVKWIIDENSDEERTITEDDVLVSWIIKCETKPDILCSPWGPM